MIVWFYGFVFAFTLILTIIYLSLWNRHFDVNITIIFILIFWVNLSYFLMWINPERGAVLVALKMIYAGGCFLPWCITMCVFSLCKIQIRKWIKVLTFSFNTVLYCTVLTIGKYPLFYKSFDVQKTEYGWEMVKSYGPMHTMFYALLALYFLASIFAVIYSYLKKKEVSRILLYLLVAPVILSFIGYACNSILKGGLEIIPVMYTLAEIVYLLIVRRMSLYEVNDMVVESMVQAGDTGFITLDYVFRYLGSNETAKNILPALRQLGIDQSVRETDLLSDTVVPWLDHFLRKEETAVFYASKPMKDGEERIYRVIINDLYDGAKKRGYQILLSDDTQDQKYIQLMDRYNSQLQEEVEEKTRSIVKMHDNLIMSMAAMVESRDNSTGGHIKRTSEGVRILIEEMIWEGRQELSPAFCHNIIKAAPMHDLGKIAVDDLILRKPGRFTDEEFAVMKKHAAEGARIVREILKTTEDEDFKRIAENVAHYHHERWDGSGYPEGLTGEEIPLEARIMAIADVYDALVSKRVYKEAMSFEKADRIITEGMGSQFDPGLNSCYQRARPKLEQYYSGLDT